MRFSEIVQELSHFPSVLASVAADDVFRFMTVASHFAQINQRSIRIDKYNAPYEYLNSALPPPAVPGTWEVLWHVLFSTFATSYVEPAGLVRAKGLNREPGALQIPERTFWPPYQEHCPNNECRDSDSSRQKLERRPAICGYLYDLDGVHSIRHHTTYCRPNCTLNIQNARRVLGLRTFQANMDPEPTTWTHQSLAHVSIYNLVTIYNSCHKLSEEASNHFAAETFKPTLSDHCCTTALDVHRLLRQFNLRKRMMSVPNSGGSRHRFREPKLNVLTWTELEGSPYIDHMCSECTEIINDPRVTGGGLAIAMDGITIGHPRCSATKEQLILINPSDNNPPPCTIMLDTPKDRYCAVHTPLLGKLCHAQPCTRDAIGNTKACNLPEHQEALLIRSEKTRRSLAALAFNQRTGAKLPEDPTAALNADTDAFNEDALIERDESDRTHEAGRDGEETSRPAGKKPFCSNAKTHNDMLFVATCGITLARETMYRAESVILVRVSSIALDIFAALNLFGRLQSGNIRKKIPRTTASPILR
ncbi:uncharacterized protein MELLADRAFT_85187 [Melampsora larici-populina 98AG31]|uniref:CxC6 like cysteine cluster associated with KDZ domain-containing protein n=1 Tax=Melampsora larici-populina (strain 98AG31 / pathotype 3-4-7) TaxID=747676 RepID=F4RHU2_MELLP|nr:uncharacterized protein MELLADRAFT_85187 [Melampsora larici-populina 98AG31]EGG07887.1 hypothetical protein MELLADRAFT_85187 [Melampsora larici-populina 98AG31]